MLVYYVGLFHFCSFCLLLFSFDSVSLVLVYDLFVINLLDYFSFYLFLDWFSVIFVAILFVIVGSVVSFMVYYFSLEINLIRFVYLFNFFVFSMVLLIVSPSFFSFLVGWDGLGFISFFLVSWYGCGSSLTSSLKTFLVNRLGDSLYLVSFVWYFSSFSFSVNSFDCFVVFILGLALCTKSAIYPFSYWLPEAMAAPTPVSALVHSSTLVVAGLYILFRLFDCLSLGFIFLFSFLSLITLFLGSFSALFTLDFKKLVAYSTLSQLGFLGCILSYGCFDLFFYYLIVHALFKASMFIVLGTFMVVGSHNQDVRLLNSLGYSTPLVSFFMLLDVSSLFGVPFLSSFYMKELVIFNSLTLSYSLVYSFLLLFSLLLTFLYSFRFLNIVFSGSCKYLVSVIRSLCWSVYPFVFLFVYMLLMGVYFFYLDCSDFNLGSSAWLLAMYFFFFFFLMGIVNYFICSYNYLNLFYLSVSYLNLKFGSFFYLLDSGIFVFSFISSLGVLVYSHFLWFYYSLVVNNLGYFVYVSLLVLFFISML